MPSKPGSPYNRAEYRRRKAAFFAVVAPICTFSRCPVPGRRVDMRLDGNAPWGPSLDHRVPTSRGGDMWDPANWRLVHRRCNGAKGDRLDPPPRRAPARSAVTRLEW